MKILIITNIPTPYRCAFFSNLNRTCKKQKIDLLVLFANNIEKNRNWDYKTFNYDFNYKILSGFSINCFKYEFHFNFNYKKLITEYNPTHTIVAGSWNMPIVLSLQLFNKKLLKKAFFWSETQKYSVQNTSTLIELFRKLIYKSFNNFLVPNSLSMDFVLKYNTSMNIFILPNTINQNVFFKRDKQFNTNKINIIQVSQLEQRKCVLELINTFKQLPKNINELFELTIIGDGPLRDQVILEIEGIKNINLINYMTQEELAINYENMDFFILASKKDPNPLSPIEAIFSGKLVFLSEFLGNANDLIMSELSKEFLFNPEKDFENIFFKMIELHKSKDLYNLYLNKIYSHVTKKWDINCVCENLINDLN